MEIRESVVPVAEADVSVRAEFIIKTYNHLLAAIGAFTVLELIFFNTGIAKAIVQAVAGMSWLIVLGAFMLVSWGASHVAHRVRSLPLQYAALSAAVLAWSVIFVPLLYVAAYHFPGVIQSAVWVTGAGFLGLTGIAWWTRKDFSFLGGVLKWAGFCALGAIVFGVIFGFELGTWFSVGMVAFAGAAILYDTSNIIHHYPEDRYVAAAMELFASVVLLLWYVIRLFMSRD